MITGPVCPREAVLRPRLALAVHGKELNLVMMGGQEDEGSRSPERAPIVVVGMLVGRGAAAAVSWAYRFHHGIEVAQAMRRLGSFHAIRTPRCHRRGDRCKTDGLINHCNLRQQDRRRMACSADGDANPPRQGRSGRSGVAELVEHYRILDESSPVLVLVHGGGRQRRLQERAGPSWALVYAVTHSTAVPGPRCVAGHGLRLRLRLAFTADDG
ncbi:hypothetical protein QBC39DRAFT_119363 [Podospora conica]|nr:hypothetical protein QBC39DRAFT_119363 [Schizothecium conicum]